MQLNDFIFTSYCFDNSAQTGDYKAQQDRLKESILKIYPTANLHFIYEPEQTGKPKFQQSLYGFKVKLVKECLDKGFKKIIFFDTAICLNDTIDYWIEMAEQYGILAPIDNQKLDSVTSKQCLKFLLLNKEDIEEWNLVGGSIYIFDFNNDICKKVFRLWEELEANGLFGTQDDLTNNKLNNHRMDETCMALSLALHSQKPLGHDLIRYAYQKPEEQILHTMGNGNYKPIAIKRHFK